MTIKRTYKDTSLKHGQVETITDEHFRKIFLQTDMFIGTCGRIISSSGDLREPGTTPREAMQKGQSIHTFFSMFEVVAE